MALVPLFVPPPAMFLEGLMYFYAIHVREGLVVTFTSVFIKRGEMVQVYSLWLCGEPAKGNGMEVLLNLRFLAKKASFD